MPLVQVLVDNETVAYAKHSSGVRRQLVEVAVCSGGCSEQLVCGACPPLPLRSGWNASQPCPCNESAGLLNCGRVLPAPCTRHEASAARPSELVARLQARHREMQPFVGGWNENVYWTPAGWLGNESVNGSHGFWVV